MDLSVGKSIKKKTSISVLICILIFSIFTIFIVFNLSKEIKFSEIGRIASVIGFVNSFITFSITHILRRRSYVGWRKWCTSTLVLLWFGIVLCLLELISPITIIVSDIVLYNIAVKTGVIIWFGGLFLLLSLIDKILNVDIITLTKPSFGTEEEKSDKKNKPIFDHFQSREENNTHIDKFGFPCIDDVFQIAQKKGVKLYFPILLMTEKLFHPWGIAKKFSREGINNGDGVIYFTFSRPANLLYESFDRDEKINSDNLCNVIIIDCFSAITDRNIPDVKCTVLLADPRNPFKLNSNYNIAIRTLKEKMHCKKLRVIYDSLTDFLFYTDIELATMYLRHNVVWEEQNNISSLYIVWPGISEKPLDDNYLKWFMNTLITMKKEENFITMEVEDLFPKMIKKYEVDNEFNLVTEIRK